MFNIIRCLTGLAGFIAALFATGTDDAPISLFVLAMILLSAGVILGFIIERR